MTILLAGILCFFIFYGKISIALLAALTGFPVLGFALFAKGHAHSHGGFVSIDVFAQGSRLSGVNPGLKVLFSVGCALFCIGLSSVPVSAFLFVTMGMLTVLCGKIPLYRYILLLTIPLAFILLGTVAILFEFSASPLGLLDIPVFGRYLCITAAGQAQALHVVCKAFGAVSCLYFLSLSTPMSQIITVLRKAKIPAVVAELMYLIYRYIFVMIETQNHMHTSASSRLGYNGVGASLKTMLKTSVNLFFLSFRRASDCFAAMESRCYDGKIEFLEDTAPLAAPEAIAAACYCALLAGFWLIGRHFL